MTSGSIKQGAEETLLLKEETTFRQLCFTHFIGDTYTGQQHFTFVFRLGQRDYKSVLISISFRRSTELFLERRYFILKEHNCGVTVSTALPPKTCGHHSKLWRCNIIYRHASSDRITNMFFINSLTVTFFLLIID